MPGPIDSLEFAHTALEREVLSLVEVADNLQRPSDATEFADRVAWLEEVGERHTKGEEVGLFPAIDAQFPRFSETYVFDHEDDEDAFSRINQALADWNAGEDAALARLRHEMRLYAYYLVRHIRKENELVIPLVGSCFTPAEQAEMVQGVLSVFSPAQVGRAVPWVVKWIDHPQRVAYVGALAANVPPEAFGKLKLGIQNVLSAEDWGALVADQPALA